MTAKIIHLPIVTRLVHDMPQEVTQAEWDAYHAARRAQWAENRKRAFTADDLILLMVVVAAAMGIGLAIGLVAQSVWLQ